MKTVLLSSVLLAGATLAALATDPAGMARYQVIIDRGPFGGLAGSAALAPQPNFAEKLVFIGVVPNGESSQLLAVIQDKERNRVEYKAEGEKIGDVTVQRIEVSATGSKLILQRLLEKATLTFPARSAAPAGGGTMTVAGVPAAGTAAAPVVPPPPMPSNFQTPNPQPGSDGSVMPPRRRIPFRRGE